MDQNNTDFPLYITKTYNEYKIKTDKEPPKKYKSKGNIELFSYQKFIEEYLSPKTEYRGLLLYFGLGSGKSISAINIAENANRRVIVMLPRSLRDNFIEEIITFVPEFNRPDNWNKMNDDERRRVQNELERKITRKYTFISSNAGNSAEKLMEAGNLGDKKDDGELKGFIDTYKTLDNSLLIIDEVHSLVSNMINPNAKNGTKILNMIMNAKNLRLLFLSGTPVVSDPFELAILFNMLRGYLTIDKSIKEQFTAFPQNYDDFHKHFVDSATNKIKNREVFQERIVGLVSYYQGARKDASLSVYPEKLKMRKVNVHMSDYQYKMYVKQRRSELDEERKIKFSTKQFVKLVNKKPARSLATTFSVGTRQICNFALPEGIEKPKKKGALEAPDLSKVLREIPESALSGNLAKYSRKMMIILQHINEINSKSLVYSEFISLEGIGIFSRVLEANGYVNFENKTNEKSKKQNKEKVFAVFSGNTPDNIRRKILDTFNSKDNLRGELMRIILFTASGAQGLNTRGVRSVHIMDPYWNNNRIEQIIGRAVRTNSHTDLPMKERNVQPFIYMSVPPTDANIELALGETLTTDQRIYRQAVEKQVLLDSFLDATREMAVDCQLNHEHNKETVGECRICVPNNKKMFPLRVENHLLAGGRTCFSEKKSIKGKLKNVVIDGRKYKEDLDGKLYEELEGQKGVYIEVKV